MSEPFSEEFAGRLIITWPKPTGPAIPGCLLAVADADTGQPIVSALDLTVTVDLNDVITAEMTMLTDEHGQLLNGGTPVRQIPTDDTGEVYTGRFRWIVAEMRVAE